MPTTPILTALATGTFVPVPEGLRDYPDQDAPVEASIDVAGNLIARAQVLTDEGGHRDDFAGAVVDPTIYSSFTALGGSISVANSLVTFTVPAAAAIGSRAIIAHEIDYLPLVANIYTNTIARVVGLDFFFGIYAVRTDLVGDARLDPANATSYVEYDLPGSAIATNMTVRAQSSAGAGASETTAAVPCATTAGGTWRSLIIEADGATWRDVSTATDALPTTNTRTRRSRHTPDLYEQLYISFGYRVTAPLATGAPTSASVDTLNIRNFNRLDANTAL